MSTDTGFRFDNVVFFGRGIDEYIKMFALDLESMRGLSVLDCGSGPAAFALQAAERGINVTACDPMYQSDAVELRAAVDKAATAVTARQEQGRHLLYDEVVPTAERRRYMEMFLADYAAGKASGRYVAGQLPRLPFADKSFDMVVGGNLLFIYSSTDSGGMMDGSPFDYEFHSKAVADLIRVCRGDIRIYPLIGAGAKHHAYLDRIIAECHESGHSAVVEPVIQRDLIGAEQMLHITCR